MPPPRACLALVLAALGFGVADAVPELEIECLNDAQILLTWEETQGIIDLETSIDLENWLSVTAPPSLIDGKVRVISAKLPDERFYRLRSNAGLYVVNQQEDFIGFADFETANGNVAPSSSLSRGAATSLFQPRAAVVTGSGRLLISRGNGGIVGWNKATEAVDSAPADLVVDGAGTFLSSPIAFAYDPDDDRLFVGNVQAAMGILVFDDVSAAGFDGEVAPDRTFGPDDRVPHSGSIPMTIDAFKLMDDGTLYVVDTSGTAQNSSRILVYNNPASANGEVNPARTITGPWSKLRGIEVAGNRLYAVDDSNTLFVVGNAGSASGSVTPGEVTMEGSAVALRSVAAFDGELYFLDEGNAAILVLGSLPNGSEPSVAPVRAIDGSATRLRLPSNMYLSRGFLDP